MKATIKKALAEKKLPIHRPNRKQGKTLPLCVCGGTKKEHFGGKLGCIFKAGTQKNATERA